LTILEVTLVAVLAYAWGGWVFLISNEEISTTMKRAMITDLLLNTMKGAKDNSK
jgi:hypothetical protein